MSRPARPEDAGLALGRPLAADAFRAETAALAAIASGYEDARARIIAAEPPAPPGRHRADATPATPPGWAPTVPVELAPGLPLPPERARPAVRDPRDPAPAGRWWDFLRRRPR